MKSSALSGMGLSVFVPLLTFVVGLSLLPFVPLTTFHLTSCADAALEEFNKPVPSEEVLSNVLLYGKVAVSAVLNQPVRDFDFYSFINTHLVTALRDARDVASLLPLEICGIGMKKEGQSYPDYLKENHNVPKEWEKYRCGSQSTPYDIGAAWSDGNRREGSLIFSDDAPLTLLRFAFGNAPSIVKGRSYPQDDTLFMVTRLDPGNISNLFRGGNGTTPFAKIGPWGMDLNGPGTISVIISQIGKYLGVSIAAFVVLVILIFGASLLLYVGFYYRCVLPRRERQERLQRYISLRQGHQAPPPAGEFGAVGLQPPSEQIFPYREEANLRARNYNVIAGDGAYGSGGTLATTYVPAPGLSSQYASSSLAPPSTSSNAVLPRRGINNVTGGDNINNNNSNTVISNEEIEQNYTGVLGETVKIPHEGDVEMENVEKNKNV